MASPLVLFVDDVFGRVDPAGRNSERLNICGQFLLQDVTGDEAALAGRLVIPEPVARGVFIRGQTPVKALPGDIVDNDPATVLRFARSGWKGEPWSLIFVDLCFYTGRVARHSRAGDGVPEGRPGDAEPTSYFGLDLLNALRTHCPDLPVAVLSSKSRDEVSREFALRGAVGFLPRDVDDAPEILAAFLRHHALLPDPTIVGHSPALLRALRAGRRAAAGRTNLLIRGERGTGKELLARYVHDQSGAGASSPLIVVNSAVLTADLFASELFGIDRGVATGVDARLGLFRSATGGDLFLDEIRDMVPQAQAGILRVLEDSRVTPVGSAASHAVDVRVLSATNADIEALTAGGRFRSDLLDRLRLGGTVYLPPLRERLEDIPELVEHFVRVAEAANHRALRRTIDPDALSVLQSHSWPGNVRELRNVLTAAVNEYPDVEHLVPLHLPELRSGTESPDDPLTLKTAIARIQRLATGTMPAAQIVGAYEPVGTAFGQLLLAMLKSALLEAQKRSAPSGRVVSIQSAVRMLTDDPSLTTIGAADRVKRIMALAGIAQPEDTTDPLLREAFESAVRLRPSRKRQE